MSEILVTGTDLTLAKMERDHIKKVFEICKMNVTLTARVLAVPRATLYRRMRMYGLRK